MSESYTNDQLRALARIDSGDPEDEEVFAALGSCRAELDQALRMNEIMAGRLDGLNDLIDPEFSTSMVLINGERYYSYSAIRAALSAEGTTEETS